MNSETPTSVLWTGGWDSTYRVLDLAICQERTVAPVYIEDADRESTKYELAAIDQIRQSVLSRFGPGVAGRILAMRQFHERDGDPRRAAANADYAVLKAMAPLGDQFAWLRAVIEVKDLAPIELSIVPSDTRPMRFLKGNIRPDGDAFVLIDAPSPPEVELFRPFRFPLLEISKKEIGERAAAAGFIEEMKLTYYCHFPLWRGAPCGTCRSCQSVIRETPDRMPWYGHRIARVYNAKQALVEKARKALQSRDR